MKAQSFFRPSGVLIGLFGGVIEEKFRAIGTRARPEGFLYGLRDDRARPQGSFS